MTIGEFHDLQTQAKHRDLGLNLGGLSFDRGLLADELTPLLRLAAQCVDFGV